MDRLAIVSTQFDRTLAFFNRVESKSSLIFGSNVGLLAVMLYNLEYADISTWYVVIPLIGACLLIALSLANIYQASYPNLKGGEDSLFYFKTVASKTEGGYVSAFMGQSADDMEKALLAQIWRNSQILDEKFLHVKKAFQHTLLSLLPWVTFLAASSIVNSRTLLIK